VLFVFEESGEFLIEIDEIDPDLNGLFFVTEEEFTDLCDGDGKIFDGTSNENVHFSDMMMKEVEVEFNF
jgi:hypothetical protein